MGMTIAEKIIAAAAGVECAKAGEIHTVELDRLMSNDGTTHLTIDMYNNKLKNYGTFPLGGIYDENEKNEESGASHGSVRRLPDR